MGLFFLHFNLNQDTRIYCLRHLFWFRYPSN